MKTTNTYNVKDIFSVKERFSQGHRLCAGCGAGITVRGVLRALKEKDKALISCATGCLNVSSFNYPYTSWADSYIHSAFENASATSSGAIAAYKAKKKKGELKANYKFLTFGGDGGTYDIGFQSLSGALERGDNFTYICYDNEAYMNTGIQRSSSTPLGSNTTTTPNGKYSYGKNETKKDLTKICVAHNAPYVAQTTFMTNFKDLHEKATKAIYTEGPSFLNILSPCPRGWGYDPAKIMDICKTAVDSNIWPLFEVINGKYKINYFPKKKLKVEEYLSLQSRFKHLFLKENKEILKSIQEETDRKWEELISLSKMA